MISVIFSTYNGEQTLPLMLNALIEIDKPEGGWELIAVNNNSTDNTDQILNDYQDKLPLKIYFEKKKGKNNALNSVINQITGEICVFTDDDIIPDKSWLTTFEHAVNANEDYSIFGGRIEPYWSHEPDLWNEQWINKGIVYGISPDELTQGAVSQSHIWGANMAIRSDVFKLGYQFDSNIGPDGTSSYKMGSETSFTQRLVKDGYLCWYEPSCVVQHIIKTNQMKPKWVLGRAGRFGKGIANKVLDANANKNYKTIFLIPRYFFTLLMQQYIRLIKSFLTSDTENVFKSKWEINYLIGIISEIRVKKNK